MALVCHARVNGGCSGEQGDDFALKKYKMSESEFEAGRGRGRFMVKCLRNVRVGSYVGEEFAIF